MKTYAQVTDGRVQEIILPQTYESPDQAAKDQIDPELWATMTARAGQEIPLDARFTPEFCATCIDVTELSPQPSSGWVYDGNVFSQYVAPAPTSAEILAANTAVRDSLLASATLSIAPLQDAVDLDEATDAETAALTSWKKYRVAVNRVDLTQASPAWPTAPAS